MQGQAAADWLEAEIEKLRKRNRADSVLFHTDFSAQPGTFFWTLCTV